MPIKKRRKPRLGPLSLKPLSLEEALSGAMQVKPPEESKRKAVKKKTEKKRNVKKKIKKKKP